MSSLAGSKIDAGELVGQRDVVPRAGQRRVREVADHADRAGAPRTFGASGVNCARMRIGTALSSRALQMARGVTERNQPLLPQRRAGVATDRRRWCRIVEADAGGVDVDDDELRRAGDGRGGGDEEAATASATRRIGEGRLVVMAAALLLDVLDEAEEGGALFDREHAARLPRAVFVRPARRMPLNPPARSSETAPLSASSARGSRTAAGRARRASSTTASTSAGVGIRTTRSACPPRTRGWP